MNKAQLVGRLSRDPELVSTPSGKDLCKFSVAVKRSYAKDKEEQADFIQCEAWGSTAKFVNDYFHKGDPIGVIGRIQVSNWTDSENVKHWKTSVVAEECEFVGNKTTNSEDSKQSGINGTPSFF